MEWLNDFKINYCGYCNYYRTHCQVQHNNYELQHISAGGVDLVFEEQHYELEAGSGWINLPGVFYSYLPMENPGWWEHRFVVFSGTVADAWNRAGLLPKTPWSGIGHLDFESRIDRIIELSHNLYDQVNRLEAVNLLEKLFIELNRRKATRDSTWLTGVLQSLDTMATIPDYDGIASRYGMSRRTFFRRFQQETGKTPHQYHIESRIRQAVRMLEATTLSMKEIAGTLGYADPAHFVRQFKNLYGQTPGAVRRFRQQNRHD